MSLFAVPYLPRPDKLAFLLDRLCAHRPWYSDFLWEDERSRRAATAAHLGRIFANGMLWEVYRDADLVGILLLDDLVERTSASCHFVFFDRTLADKVDLVRGVMAWVFRTLHLHVLRVEIPTHVRPLLKFARKLGFRFEAEQREPSWPHFTDEWADFAPLTEQQATLGSRKHHAMFYDGEWRDALLLSTTEEEFFAHGWSTS